MILVTGGAGYIGSHTCVALASAGLDLVLIDNFSNSGAEVSDRLNHIVGRRLAIINGDIRDQDLLDRLFSRYQFHGVMHFAGLKAVGESVAMPLTYYSNNVEGTISLLRAMERTQCRALVFSSSATVYGDAGVVPIPEDSPCAATSPYGRTKLVVEHMLCDLEAADSSWKIARLRYFNPTGAHESALIGEHPSGVPNNLMPYVMQVAAGQRPSLQVFGGDYPTNDGTGVRDYIHVMDLAEGHVEAYRYLQDQNKGLVVNLGTGRGTSVLEMIGAAERASGRQVPYHITPRRPGDVAVSYADVARAKNLLGWQAKRNIDDMCRDAWRWQTAQGSAWPGAAQSRATTSRLQDQA